MRSTALALSLALLVPASAVAQDRERLVELIQEATEADERGRLDRTGDAETREDREAAKDVRRTLATRRVTVNFDKIPWMECLDFLRDVTGLNIVITTAAAEALADRTVSLRLRDIRLRSCLELLLQQLDPDLRYGVRHGVLTLGLLDEWRQAMHLELYFVEDLLRPAPDFPAPHMGLGGKLDYERDN
jgi:hypothetical protein